MLKKVTLLGVLLVTFDDSESVHIVNSVEWMIPSEEIEHHDTNAPHVTFLIVDIVLFRDFGGAIYCGAYKAPDSIIIKIRSSPKVNQLNLLFFVYKDILRLKVSMAYTMSVALFNGFERLLNDVGHIPLSHRRSFKKPVKSVHPLKELCDKVKV